MPVHKGGAEDDPTNYRPIAVVSIIAKILEKIVATQLSNYFESNELLYPHQVHISMEDPRRIFFWWLLILLLLV